jgi:hypothetical protein
MRAIVFVTFLIYYFIKLALLVPVIVQYNQFIATLITSIFSSINTVVIIILLIHELCTENWCVAECFRIDFKKITRDKTYFSVVSEIYRPLICCVVLAIGDMLYAGIGIMNMTINDFYWFNQTETGFPANFPMANAPGQLLDPILMASYILTIIIATPGMIIITSTIIIIVIKTVVVIVTCGFCCGQCSARYWRR